MGTLYGAERVHVEAALVQALEVPRGAHSVSLSLDRVALPMEEPKARPVGRPRKDAPERPVDVVFRRAYAACLTFHMEPKAGRRRCSRQRRRATWTLGRW